MAISHVLSATTPDNPAYEIRPSHWNSVHNQYVTISGNTAGASTLSGSNIVLQGGNNITLSADSDTLAFHGVAAQSNVAFSANASSTFQTLSFQNSNGVSFSNNAGALRVTHDLAGTGTSITGGAAITLNSAGLAFNGASIAGTNTAVTGRASITLNSAGLSFNGTGLAGTATAITGGAVATLNSAGLSFDGSALAGTGTAVTGRASMTLNSTGLSFNGSALVGSGTATAITGRASMTIAPNSSSIAMSFDGSNLAGVGTGTAVTGRGSVSLAVNSSSVAISFDGSNLAGVGTGTAVTGRGSISLAVNSSSVAMSFDGSNLAGVGTGTAVTGRASVTLTANSSSIALSFDGGGIAGTGFTTGSTTGKWSATNSTNGLSEVMPYLTQVVLPIGGAITAVTAPGNATMSFQYVAFDGYLTATRVDALIGMSFSTTAGAGTQTLQQSVYCAIFTKNAASLSSLSSGSTQTTWTMASNTAGQTQLSQAAIRRVSCPVNINMQPGEYFIGFNYVTAGTAVSMTHSIYGGNNIQTASNFAEMGSTTNATTGQLWGAVGLYAAASTGIPASISISSINQTGANLSAANIALVLRNA